MSVSFNIPIGFGRGGSAAALDTTGIDFNDDGGWSWTTGALAELDLRLPPAREDVTLEIEAGAYVREGMPQQQVFGYLGGAFIGFWRVRGYGTLTARVPRTLLPGRATRLAFALSDAVSPFALGLSEDKRELGLHLHAITFKLGQ